LKTKVETGRQFLAQNWGGFEVKKTGQPTSKTMSEKKALLLKNKTTLKSEKRTTGKKEGPKRRGAP